MTWWPLPGEGSVSGWPANRKNGLSLGGFVRRPRGHSRNRSGPDRSVPPKNTYGALARNDRGKSRPHGAAGTVAVLLPGAFYYLQETRRPPIDMLRRYNIPMAVATDCNPGSSPVGSILSMLNMACVLFRLTPEEALSGVTCHAARALGIHGQTGILAPGRDADFVIWAIDDPAELAYGLGFNPCRQVIRKGKNTI